VHLIDVYSYMVEGDRLAITSSTAAQEQASKLSLALDLAEQY
jgi:hypothetical protein